MEKQKLWTRTRRPIVQQHRHRPQHPDRPAVSLPEALRAHTPQRFVSFFVENASEEDIEAARQTQAKPGVLGEALAVLVMTAFLPVMLYGLQFVLQSLFM